MDEAASSAATARKVRFAPKLKVRQTHKIVEPKSEVVAAADAHQIQELLSRVNEGPRRGLRLERKSETVQVAFGQTGESTSIRTFGRGSSSSASNIEGPVSDDGRYLLYEKKKKDYAEPWDYYSYYPATLPIRRPHSGDPELLDDEEFGEASADLEYDESFISPAAELGLTEECGQERMLFLQLPATLPLVRRSLSVNGKEVIDSSKPFRRGAQPQKDCGLGDMPAGFMGKMLVYKSGAVKLKLGEIIYDVSPGLDCVFAQNVAAINLKEKHCCDLGELDKRAVITPNVDSLLKGCD
ncbi:hypothetical protein IFM89_024149 [Coptis chinensis]|uniref:DNA-directed RNA polymerase III subunit RPC4 n=1 Tax=Coptis chinensis TaxID=261450 RepID=A0A835IFL8_9MAGN|nr:hypothetical protein IFM89_024149 [Coptis chinensis]